MVTVLASCFPPDALCGLVSSSRRHDSPRSVKTQHLFAAAAAVQSPRVTSRSFSGILFSAGTKATDVIWLQTFNQKHSGVPSVLPACEGKRM